MKLFVDFIKKNAVILLHIFCTFVLSTILSLFFSYFSDYLLFGNIILCLIAVYFVYKIIFKKEYSDSFLKIMCLVFILIAINKLYSYDRLTTLLPWFASLNQNIITIALIVIAIIILLFFKLLTLIEKGKEATQAPKSIPNSAPNIDSSVTSATNISPVISNEKKELYSFLRFLGMLVLLLFLITVPIVLLYVFHKNQFEYELLAFDKVLTFILSYGASFLLILLAIVIVLIALFYLVKYMYNLLLSFSNKTKGEKPFPTYAISVVVVCILLFLAWKISDYTIDDLTETLVAGEYLAFPIAAIVAIVLFFLLVQIVHTILLMLNKMTVDNITKFLKEQNGKLKVTEQIHEIINSIITIILTSISAILNFIKFIPDFFTSLSNMVLSNDNEECSTDEEYSETEN